MTSYTYQLRGLNFLHIFLDIPGISKDNLQIWSPGIFSQTFQAHVLVDMFYDNYISYSHIF